MNIFASGPRTCFGSFDAPRGAVNDDVDVYVDIFRQTETVSSRAETKKTNSPNVTLKVN